MTNTARRVSLFVVALAIPLIFSSCSADVRKGRHLERADRYYEQKKYAEAVIEYMNVLRLENSNQVAIARIGLAQFAQGELKPMCYASARKPGSKDLS